MDYTSVTAAEVDAAGLDDWRYDDTTIRAAFRAPDYVAAARMIVEIAEAAEAECHHPVIELRYPGVAVVALSTHETGGLTTVDLSLARTISALAAAADALAEVP